MNIPRRFLASFIALLCSALPALHVRAQGTYVGVEQLWPFRAAVAGDAQTAGNWVAAAGDTLWLFDPSSGVVRRTKRGTRGERGTTHQVTSERLPLPAGLPQHDLARLDITVAAVSETEAWLVDHTGRRLWRRNGAEWLGPWLIGETIGSAAATRSGELIVNTPAHSTNALALIGRDGTIVRRFGARLQPQRPGLDEDWNQWVVAVLPDGRFIAAHRYSDRLRAYDLQTRLLWERQAEFPTVERFRTMGREAEASIRVDPATCCYTAKLVRFASRIVPIGSGLAVQFGTGSALQELDADGTWKTTLPLRSAHGTNLQLLGIAAAGPDLVAVTPAGLTRLARVADDRLIAGAVVDESERPVPSADVEFVSASGAKFRARSDEAGRFAVVVDDRREWHDVTVAAAGFRTWTRGGSLHRLMGEPIVLARPLRQCVRVTDAATGAPVTRFELEILREHADARSVSRTRGARQSFESADGTGCLASPWEHPWTVRISASGYATRKSAVTEGLQLDVALEPGAVMEVLVEDPSGAPVEGASLRLSAAGDAQRSVVMVEDEAQTSTNDRGEARLEGIAAGEYRIEGSSERFLPFVRDVTIEPGVNRERIVVERGASLHVRVVSQAGGSAVEGAAVVAEPLNQALPRTLQCTTKVDGRCSIEALPAGRYQARARAEGFVEAQRPFEVAPNRRDVEATLPLDASIRLTGAVEGAAQYPDSELEVLGSKPGVPFLSAPVDANGAFAFEEFPSGDVNLRVRQRGQNSTLVYQRVTIPSGRPSHHVTLRLPAPYVLRGTIRHRQTPCGGCTLSVEGFGGGVDRFASDATVTPSGDYSLRLPGRGLYVFQAAAPDGASERRVLEIAASAREDFDLDDRERTIVTVVDERGTPVESARVVALDVAHGVTLADVATDSRGRAPLPHLTKEARITASRDDAFGSHLHRGTGAATIEIVIRPAARLQLDLRDARTGAPVYRAQVRVRSSRTGQDAGTWLLSRSDERAFSLTIGAEGPVDLVVKAPGYAFKTVYGVEGSAVQRIDVAGGLTMGVRVEGDLRPCAFELRDAAGRIYALSTDVPLGPIPLTRTEAIFNPVEAGTYVATLHTCAGESLRRTAVVAPGQATPLVVFSR